MNTLTAPTANNEVLDALASYQHPGLVARLQRKLGLDEQEAQGLFEDVKRFLYVATVSSTPSTPSKMIDEGWHNFILFSKDYSDFCVRYFGKFLHHFPKTVGIDAQQNPIVDQIETSVLAESIFGRLSSNWAASVQDNALCEPGSTSCHVETCSEQDK